MTRIGAHVSIAGGLLLAVQRAIKIGAEGVIFHWPSHEQVEFVAFRSALVFLVGVRRLLLRLPNSGLMAESIAKEDRLRKY